MPQKHLNL